MDNMVVVVMRWSPQCSPPSLKVGEQCVMCMGVKGWDFMGPYYSILQIWVHDTCHPRLLACYTCACELMSLVIPMLISHHVDIEGQPFWNFRLVRAHEH